MKTIVFKDQGQDFLEWDIEYINGSPGIVPDYYVVVASRPFQEEVWLGTRVIVDQAIGAGCVLEIITPGGRSTQLVHPVKEVREA